MLYVPVKHLKKGMLLARNIYNEKLELAFPSGLKIKSAHVEQITKMGYPGAYIMDTCSGEVVPDPLIPEEQYIGAARLAKRLLQIAMADEKNQEHISQDEYRGLVMNVIQVLSSKRNPIIESIDIKPFAGYDYYHAASAMIISLLIGMKFGLNETQLYELGVSSLFHDIGNAFLPMNLLNRPGVLSDEEFAIIKEHANRGFEYMRDNYSLPVATCMGVLQHHENYDGTGYPNNLKRKNISLFGRIIAITDVYDALVSKRSFRTAMYPLQALEVIQQHSDRKFDPDVVDNLEKVIAPYPTGVLVDVKTGERCIVSKNYPADIKRPRLQLYDGKQPRFDFIDLHADPEHAKTRITKIWE